MFGRTLGIVSTRVYELYGKRVRSTQPLPAPVSDDALSAPDIELHWDDSKIVADHEPAAERVCAELRFHNGQGYTLTEAAGGYRLRFYGVCDFEIAEHLRVVRVRLMGAAAGRLAALLFSGSAMAWLLRLAGDCVLHASAVEVGGAALALAGGSGTGKSTLAAWLCAAGAVCITDDVLRLQPTGRGFRCFPGTAQIRLRKRAGDFAVRCRALPRSVTADGRIALTFKRPAGTPTLRAVVIPRPSRHCDKVRLEPRPCATALRDLMAHAGTHGRQDPDYLSRQFRAFAGIVERVPVFLAEIPWWSSLSTESIAALLQACRLNPTGAGAVLPQA